MFPLNNVETPSPLSVFNNCEFRRPQTSSGRIDQVTCQASNSGNQGDLIQISREAQADLEIGTGALSGPGGYTAQTGVFARYRESEIMRVAGFSAEHYYVAGLDAGARASSENGSPSASAGVGLFLGQGFEYQNPDGTGAAAYGQISRGVGADIAFGLDTGYNQETGNYHVGINGSFSGIGPVGVAGEFSADISREEVLRVANLASEHRGDTLGLILGVFGD